MKKLIVLATFIGVAASAQAGESSGDFQRRWPGANPFEKLRSLFNESRDEIRLDDIKDPHRKCAGASGISVQPFDTELNVYSSRREVSPGMPAQPARGPLFPETPARPPTFITKTAVFPMGKQSQETVDGLFDGIELNVERDQVTGIYRSTPKVTLAVHVLVVRVRRNGDLVAFRYNTPSGDRYGYCWIELP